MKEQVIVGAENLLPLILVKCVGVGAEYLPPFTSGRVRGDGIYNNRFRSVRGGRTQVKEQIIVGAENLLPLILVKCVGVGAEYLPPFTSGRVRGDGIYNNWLRSVHRDVGRK